MRCLAVLLCTLPALATGCDGHSAFDLGPSPLAMALAADSGVTALDTVVVNGTPHYRCRMGLRVRGNSTISGETAFWTGASYRLDEAGTEGPTIPVTAGELIGWFRTDRVLPGEIVATDRTFEWIRPFDGVTVSIQVELMGETQSSGAPRMLTTSFRCG